MIALYSEPSPVCKMHLQKYSMNVSSGSMVLVLFSVNIKGHMKKKPQNNNLIKEKVLFEARRLSLAPVT